MCEYCYLFREEINLGVHDLLIGEQLRIIGLQLDIFIQHLRVLAGEEVYGLLELGKDVNLPLLPGGEPGHDGPDCATREQKHDQILQYLVIHNEGRLKAA